jgi:ubiquinone/menaquinone biosynthesis C-methylase UbiE
MGFYRERVVPHLINLSMRNAHFLPYRRRVIGAADGRVLEIGIGSGLNLPFYGAKVREIFGLEPSPRLAAMAERASRKTGRAVNLVEGSAEAIPMDSGSFDTVVTTWTLCSIPEAVKALGEMRRVLKPGGQLLFVEHGLAPEQNVQKWQHRLTPVWKRIGGGCHLDRPIRTLVETAGFDIVALENSYLPRAPQALGYFYEGRARP